MNESQARLDAARAKRDALEDEVHKLGALAEAGTITDAQAERFERQVAAHAHAKADVIEAELEIRNHKVAEIQRGFADGSVYTESSNAAPDLGVTHRGDDLRTKALRAVDGLSKASDAARHTLAGAIDGASQYEDKTELDIMTRWTLVTSRPAYERAFAKVFRDPQFGHREFTAEEVDAYQDAQRLQRAMSVGTGSAGGFLLPTHLDPAIITSSGNYPSNPFAELSPRAVIATNTWNGVSATLVAASWAGEAAEVSDDTPTFAQPSIDTHKIQAFIPVSIEAFEDTGISAQVGAMFAEAIDYQAGVAFTTGTGSSSVPEGIITALDGTASPVSPATPETYARADTYALQEALPARWRPNARWMMSLDILNDTRQFSRLSSGTEVPLVDDSGQRAKLLGWDVHLNDNMDTGLDAAATADNFIA